MKKSVVVSLFLVTILVTLGCNNQQPVESPKVNPGVEVQNETKSVPTVANQKESLCNRENPPSVKEAKFGKVLNFCGKETAYRAYEFKDQNFILFDEDIWNESKQRHNYSIKIISTIAPFEEKTLMAGLDLYLEQDPASIGKNDSYVWYNYADAPGSFFSFFVFQPKTQDFAYVRQACNSNFECDKSMELASSKSSKTLSLIESKASEEEKKLLSCSFQQDKLLGSKDSDIKLLTSYVSNIPNKIDCYDNKYPTANKIGYIDLSTLKFVGN